MDTAEPSVDAAVGQHGGGDNGDFNKHGRRKACDLCFTKKIKCDMLKPVCSNCKLYKARCCTSMIRRKANPPRPRPAPDAAPVSVAAREDREARMESARDQDKNAMEDRLARIERQLQQVLDVADKLSGRSNAADEEASVSGPFSQMGSTRAPSTPSTIPLSTTDSSHGSNGNSDDSHIEHITDSSSGTGTHQRTHHRFQPLDQLSPSAVSYDASFESSTPDDLRVPPRHMLLPLVDHYFETFNTAVPLFHRHSFMRMVESWFNRPGTRNKATWAAILIVAAIALRASRHEGQEQQEQQEQQQRQRAAYANCCLGLAQSAVSELVHRDEDLLGIQVLLGIVVLFRDSADPRPASVFIGTAVRLAHRLQLHARVSRRYFSAEEADQRSRVFWIAYTLDKTISLRTRAPSVQLDGDIDTPLPPLAPTDGAGLIWTLDGRHNLNYHRRRAELAHLEGCVFDQLYSNRAAARLRRGTERQHVVARLTGLLDAWYARIPRAFRLDQASTATLGPWAAREVTKLLHVFLLAYTTASGLYSRNADWVRPLSSTGKAAVQDLSTLKGPDGDIRHVQDQQEDSPLPSATWARCVELSRGCMRLYQSMKPTECLVWECSCAYFTALIVLLAEMYMRPTHAAVGEDQVLTAKAMRAFEKTLDMFKYPSCKSLRFIINELYQKATDAVEETGRLADDVHRGGGSFTVVAGSGSDSSNGRARGGGGGGDGNGYTHSDSVFPEVHHLHSLGAEIPASDVFEVLTNQDMDPETVFDVFAVDMGMDVNTETNPLPSPAQWLRWET